MVREFKLINEKGQEYSLMDLKNYCFLSEPTGLGYSYTTEYEQLGYTFITNLRKFEQGTISGTANFSSYDNYKKLVDFIEASENLRFVYKIPYQSGTKEYFKDVQIQSISKTQKQTNGIIAETVTFDCLSLWYEENTFIHDMRQQEGSIAWDFKWDSKFTDFTTRSLQYINNGHVDAPILAEIDGPVLNPKIQLYVEGELYQELPFTVDIKEYEKLLYGTKEGEFYLNKQNTDGSLENLFNLDVLDPKDDEIIRIPKNKSCELKLVADEDILNAKVTIFAYYKAV